MEEYTYYYDSLIKSDCYWFSDLWLMCADLMKELPMQTDDFYLDAIKKGGRNLNSLSQMTNYLGYFGRFYWFLGSYPFEDLIPYEFFEKKEINIVDYGCGQAIWSMLYSHWLRQMCHEQIKNKITLIEPSELLLKRAVLHASVFYPGTRVITVNKKLDDLTNDDIVCDDNIPTLHILADVLERQDFDMDRLAGMIKNSIKGMNRFLCVQLYFGNYQEDNRVRKFASYFTDKYDYGCIPQKDMDLAINENPILKEVTCHYITFTVGDHCCPLKNRYSSLK